MKLGKFLEENKVTFYKSTQLQGKDPNHNSGIIKKRIIGEMPMKMVELTEFCAQLEAYLKKPVKPEMFEYEVEAVVLKA